MEKNVNTPDGPKKAAEHPFRSAVLRGLGVVTPPLLTIVIFLWIGGTVNQYVLRPCSDGVRNPAPWTISEATTRMARALTVRRRFRRPVCGLATATFEPASVAS